VRPCCIYLDLSKYGGITSYDITLCVRFFQNDDNQVNIGDPIEHIMINEYHIPYMIQVVYRTMKKILPRRMSTTACIFSSHFGQEMAQNADLPISCKNFSGVTPSPCPVLGHRDVVSRFPLFWLTQLSDR